MLHLAVASLPRDFGGVEDCLFRCSPIDNLITLCQVKSNCPKQWKSQESHLCQHGSRHSLCPVIFTCIFLMSLPLPQRSISSQLNAISAFYWITISESLPDIFSPTHISILTLQLFQSSLRMVRETGSPLKYYCCIIWYQNIKCVDK